MQTHNGGNTHPVWACRIHQAQTQNILRGSWSVNNINQWKTHLLGGREFPWRKALLFCLCLCVRVRVCVRKFGRQAGCTIFIFLNCWQHVDWKKGIFIFFYFVEKSMTFQWDSFPATKHEKMKAFKKNQINKRNWFRNVSSLDGKMHTLKRRGKQMAARI